MADSSHVLYLLRQRAATYLGVLSSADRPTEVLDLPSLLVDANTALGNPVLLVEDSASNGAYVFGARGSWEG